MALDLAKLRLVRARNAEKQPGAVVSAFKVVTAAQAAEPIAVVPKMPGATVLAKLRRQANPAGFAEVDRICAMPVILGYSDEEREAFQLANCTAKYYEKGWRFHPIQVDAILTYENYGMLLAPIGVGHGKTLIMLATAAKAMKAGVKRSLYLVPSSVMPQLVDNDIAWARQRAVLYGLPFHIIGGSKLHRKAVATSGRIGCYVMPYSLLSSPDAQDLLESINPDLILGDEAHNVRHPRAARTKRLMSFIQSRKLAGKPVNCEWASGTITSKSVMDYHHLVVPFGEYCPLPRTGGAAVEWASVLDSNQEYNEDKTGPVRPLLSWAMHQEKGPDCPSTGTGFRRAYRYRLITNPVVVATGDSEIGTSLTIQQINTELIPSYPGAAELRRLQLRVQKEWLTPAGDEIEHAFHMYKWLYELSAGMYNDLYWPEPETVARRLTVPMNAAEELLVFAKQRHAVLNEYNRELRTWLQSTHIKNLDTPMFVARSFARVGNKDVKNEKMYMLWFQAKKMLEANPLMPDRDSRVVRLCDYKIGAAIKWAEAHPDGILWYYHNGVGDWLHEMLPDDLYCPAGDAFNRSILQSHGRRVLASVSAHGTGKNLQFHQHQLFVQPLRSAQLMEQALGRLHRFGQEADELFADMLIQQRMTGEPTFDQLVYAACLNDGLYIQQTTGSKQKVIYSGYNPLPRIIPSEVLAERGLTPELLSADQQQLLSERFAATAASK